MIRFAQFAVALLVAVSSVSAQQTPVALVHGGYSDPSTWASAAGTLQATGNYTTHEVSSIDWHQHLSDEATALITELNGIGYGTSSFLVGHSQGGLISRLAARSDSVAGLVTMGTPNQGMPLVDAHFEIEGYVALLSVDYATVFNDLADEDDCFPDEDSICQYVPDALNAMAIGAPLGLTALNIGLEYASTAWQDLGDMSPSSSVILGLEAQPGLERVGKRGYIQFDDADESAGPFRLIHDESDANGEMTVLNAYGLEMAFDGVSIEIGDDASTDPGYIYHQEAGETLEDMGAILDGFAYIWNQWVAGGFGNDGLIPWSSQPLPNASFSAQVIGFSHTEETSQGGTLATLLDRMRD